MSSDPVALYYPRATARNIDEAAAVVTHGIGLILSLLGGIPLLAVAAAQGQPRSLWGCGFYVVALVGVYAASTLSHLPFPERQRRLFRSLDQAFIYLLIVGTFTPFAVKYLSTPGWIGFYGLILLMGLAGFVSKLLFAHRLEDVSVFLYVALGWGEAIAIQPILGLIPPSGLYWLVAGGLCYTVGTVFLVHDVRRSYFHTIWHVLVMAGSLCHYIAVFQCVVRHGY